MTLLLVAVVSSALKLLIPPLTAASVGSSQNQTRPAFKNLSMHDSQSKKIQHECVGICAFTYSSRSEDPGPHAVFFPRCYGMGRGTSIVTVAVVVVVVPGGWGKESL